MDLSRGLIQSGTQLLSKKVRAVRITLKAGYKSCSYLKNHKLNER